MTENINGYIYTENYKPNKYYITDNPVSQTEQQEPKLCCNQAKFALNRCKGISAPMKKNYYSDTRQYLRARCNLYEQKSFNFTNGLIDEQTNQQIYYGNCQPSSNNNEKGLTLNLLQLLVQLNISQSIPANVFTFAEALAYINTLSNPQKQYGNNIYVWYMNDPYLGVPKQGPAYSVCPQVMYKPLNYKFATNTAISGQQYALYKSMQSIAYDTNQLNFSKYKFGPILKQCNGVCINPHIRGGS
jgi:hypothetical protein